MNNTLWNPVKVTSLIDRAEFISELNSLENCIDEWINDYSQRFDPFRGDDRREQKGRRTAFSEAALYLYLAKEFDDKDVPLDLHDLVVARVNDQRYYHSVRRDSGNLTNYFTPIYYVKSCNSLDPDVATTVESVLNENAVWSHERPAHRQMDLWHSCEIYGYSDSGLDPESILELSCLAYPPSIINSDLIGAYSLTHNVLFYHNFGIDNPNFPNSSASYDLRETIVGLVFRYMAAGNVDIVLELIMAGILQRQLSADFVRFVLSWVVEKTNQHGYISEYDPETETQMSQFEFRFGVDLRSWDDEEREWAYNYHSNLVAGMAIRLIKRDWSRLDRMDHSRLDDEIVIKDSQRLGQLLHALSRYDLQLGAHRIVDLDGSPAVEQYPEAFEASIAFLRKQKNENGNYGFWTREREKYLELKGDQSSFHAEIVQPVTEACTKALETVASRKQSDDLSDKQG